MRTSERRRSWWTPAFGDHPGCRRLHAAGSRRVRVHRPHGRRRRGDDRACAADNRRPLADALIAPCVGIWALATFAAASRSAVLRVDEDNLHPDAARAFVETLLRAPFLLVPFAPAIVLSGLGVYIAGPRSRTRSDIGPPRASSSPCSCSPSSTPISGPLFVPALFSRAHPCARRRAAREPCIEAANRRRRPSLVGGSASRGGSSLSAASLPASGHSRRR